MDWESLRYPSYQKEMRYSKERSYKLSRLCCRIGTKLRTCYNTNGQGKNQLEEPATDKYWSPSQLYAVANKRKASFLNEDIHLWRMGSRWLGIHVQ